MAKSKISSAKKNQSQKRKKTKISTSAVIRKKSKKKPAVTNKKGSLKRKKVIKKRLLSSKSKSTRKYSRKKNAKQQPAVEIAQEQQPVVQSIRAEVPSLPQKWEYTEELPQRYGENKIVLLGRDPWWLYTYWEVCEETTKALQEEHGTNFTEGRCVLRVYNITGVESFLGDNANEYYEIEIGNKANSWYIEVPESGHSWCVDVGFCLKDGTFICIARSNIVQTPLGRPSDIYDEEWMIPEELFQRLFGNSTIPTTFGSMEHRQFGSQLFPWGISSFINVSSGGVSSFGLFSPFQAGSWSMGSGGISSLKMLKPHKGNGAGTTVLTKEKARKPDGQKYRRNIKTRVTQLKNHRKISLRKR